MSQKSLELKQFLAKIDTPFYRKALINCKRAEGSNDEQKKLAEAIDEVVPIVHGVLSEIGKSRSANEVLQTEIKALRDENIKLTDEKQKCLNLNTSLFGENETLLKSLSEMLNMVESLNLEPLSGKLVKPERLKRPEKSVKSVPTNNEEKVEVVKETDKEIEKLEKTEKVERLDVIKKPQEENVKSPCLEDGEIADTPVPSPRVKTYPVNPDPVNERINETVVGDFRAEMTTNQAPTLEVKPNAKNETSLNNSCDNGKSSNPEEYVNISDSDDGFDGFRKRIHTNKSEEDSNSDFCEIIEHPRSIPSPSRKMKRKIKDSSSPFSSIKKKANFNGLIKRSARIDAKGSKSEQPRGHVHPAQIICPEKRRLSFQNSSAR
ncbi:uncharacterized protein LOC141854445 isoform X2 [Brevipalpus obovatus]|uniref:uncharacterized protein LOC141854445 isoform X2 n=1 Tax=Brevipalpus obovatus TaxID=246614 RepID=UPI003D9DEE99